MLEPELEHGSSVLRSDILPTVGFRPFKLLKFAILLNTRSETFSINFFKKIFIYLFSFIDTATVS